MCASMSWASFATLEGTKVYRSNHDLPREGAKVLKVRPKRALLTLIMC